MVCCAYDPLLPSHLLSEYMFFLSELAIEQGRCVSVAHTEYSQALADSTDFLPGQEHQFADDEDEYDQFDDFDDAVCCTSTSICAM